MSITIAQLTDTHLCCHPDAELRGSRPWHSLKAVVQQVAKINPDYLLLTGDLADRGSPSAYQQLIDLISPLQIPTYWLSGNHDRLSVMREVLVHSLFHAPKAVLLGGWQLILLDSTLANSRFGEGEISPQSLQFLAKSLEVELPTLIALHHHPLPFGIDWLDQMQVQNADEFLALIDRASQVQAVVFGHIHTAFHQQQGNTHFYGSPSTCLQLDLPQATPKDKLPGFRLLHLHPDGTHQTEVHRVMV
ncbi:metallophosphoesterase [Allocoleopsis franciscana]|uniref:Putative phosphohydrolase n=1 Tax=Allocoleopsis franciscana PCC 7113 TaxID=1173027 RepID=K9WGG3_9CYAN|nr:metallophosphoesterase [Allocoleopsis franciscana]AFZ18879.1 putative phosphohydrolase [Allocoleopsis franciscana PCC 7113]